MTGRISIEVPDKFRLAASDAHGEDNISRWALEAVVVQALREGLVTRGYASEILGFRFSQREAFFAERGISFDAPDEVENS
jgi:predicted HTH domain antitoxin